MATILVTHGIPAEGFSLLSGEKIVIPKPLMLFTGRTRGADSGSGCGRCVRRAAG